VLAWSGVILLLTSLPYLYGALISTPQSQFGGFVIAVEDGHAYLAAMRQGADGALAFYVPYTPEPHTPGYVFAFYLLLGKIARMLGLSRPLTHHLAKVITTPLLLVSIYRFVAHFTGWRILRRLSFLLVGLGGGLGWLWLLVRQPFTPGVMPIDLWVPDAFAFLTMLTFPHLALAQALILWIAVSGLRLLHHPDWRMTLVTGALGLVLSLIHPYSLELALGLLGLYWALDAWRTRRPAWMSLAQLAAIGLVSAPYLLYSLILFSTNPVFASWRLQNRILSPNPIYYLLGYGLVGLLALLGMVRPRWLRRLRDQDFLYLWAILIPVGLYLPSNLQRRFLDGYQAPLTLLAVGGLIYLLRGVARRWRWGIVSTVVAASLLSNLTLLLGSTALVVSRSPLVFEERPALAAMDWLADHAPQQSLVLGAYDTGNVLPGRAPVRTFVGHGPQSVNADEKEAQVSAFFNAATSDRQRLTLLTSYGVNYVFYGPSERALGSFSPADAPYLRLVYDNGPVQIYQVCAHLEPPASCGPAGDQALSDEN
jgi:hypothetical protein